MEEGRLWARYGDFGAIPRRFTMEKKTYPLVNIQKAIENGPVEIVDLPS